MKILVVEDNPQVAETIMDYLELAGHRLDCAYHGQAALQLLEEHEQLVEEHGRLQEKTQVLAEKHGRKFDCFNQCLRSHIQDQLIESMPARFAVRFLCV